jgi:membrane-associated protease RseP (regulator of RpoE activity)
LGAPGGPLLGVRTVPLTIELRRQFKVAADVDGALVTAVTGDSPADRIGIMPGMLITAVNGQAIRGPDTLSALVRQAGPGQEIDLSFRDQNGELHRRVVLAGAAVAARPQQPPGQPQQPTQPPSPLQLPGPSDLSDPTVLPGGPAREESTIQSLERRIQQLEARVEKLEAALRGKE